MKILKQIADQEIQQISEKELIEDIGQDNVKQIKCDLHNMTEQTYSVDDIEYIITKKDF